jgi:hypothetical protein
MAQALADISIQSLSLSRQVHKTICYFDIFNHPLKAEEILKFCGEKMSMDELQVSLKDLQDRGAIKKCKGYYFLSEASESVISRRMESEFILTSRLSKIKRYARLVSKFPFVEGVFISGSVSKGIMDEKGDVDYFIIASPRRVWLCRTLLIAFKKIFLFNSRKYFCVNYFIDSSNLLIPDHNIFTATEIATLLPVNESELKDRFFKNNEWVKKIYPNHHAPADALISEPVQRPLFSRFIEKVVKGSLGEWLDNYCLQKTLRRWQKKFPHFNRQEFDLNMRSYKNVSKHHPQGNQQKVLNALEERMARFV